MTPSWLDANVVIRYLTNEPEHQANRVRHLMREAENGNVILFLDRLVVAEIIWALSSSIYRLSLSAIAEYLIPFLSSDRLQVEDKELIIDSIELARDREVDFIDAYLSLRAFRNDQTVYTFDKTDFKKLPAKWTAP